MLFVLFPVCCSFWGGLVIFESSYAKGISVGGTRLIYDASKREASLSVRNSADGVPHLVQSWVDDFNDETIKAPFIITPPLFRLDPGRENILRVIYTGENALPQDRESVFWLNVKTIPATEKTDADTNKLIIAVKTRIKLFFRPRNLQTEAAHDAWRKLIFTYHNNYLFIQNPTPYFVSLFSLSIGDHQRIASPPMIAPFSMTSVSITTADAGSWVAWQAITDYGSITAPTTAELTIDDSSPAFVLEHPEMTLPQVKSSNR